MTTTIYLDLETLVIEEKESTRDYMELLDSAQKYYAKKGIRTMKGRIGHEDMFQEYSVHGLSAKILQTVLPAESTKNLPVEKRLYSL